MLIHVDFTVANAWLAEIIVMPPPLRFHDAPHHDVWCRIPPSGSIGITSPIGKGRHHVHIRPVSCQIPAKAVDFEIIFDFINQLIVTLRSIETFLGIDFFSKET